MIDILGGTASEFAGIGLAVLAASGLAVQALAVRLGTSKRSVPDVLALVFAINLLVIAPVVTLSARSADGVTPVALGAFALTGILGSLLGLGSQYEPEGSPLVKYCREHPNDRLCQRVQSNEMVAKFLAGLMGGPGNDQSPVPMPFGSVETVGPVGPDGNIDDYPAVAPPVCYSRSNRRAGERR